MQWGAGLMCTVSFVSTYQRCQIERKNKRHGRYGHGVDLNISSVKTAIAELLFLFYRPVDNKLMQAWSIDISPYV